MANPISNALLMQILNHHIQSYSNPPDGPNPLAGDQLTAFIHDLHDNSPHTPDEDSFLRGLGDHVDAIDDPNHPLAGHDVTTVLRHLRDAVSGSNPSIPAHMVPQFSAAPAQVPQQAQTQPVATAMQATPQGRQVMNPSALQQALASRMKRGM